MDSYYFGSVDMVLEPFFAGLLDGFYDEDDLKTEGNSSRKQFLKVKDLDNR